VENKARILVAGVGGASLGTEILKCLKQSGRYTVYGCDISEFAYGHYQNNTAASFVVRRDRYIESLLEICAAHGIQAIIPGGEEPLVLLCQSADRLEQSGVLLAANSPHLITLCSDKKRLFERLREEGLPIPRTLAVEDARGVEHLDEVGYPCVTKPTTGSGGSRLVSLASCKAEAAFSVNQILGEGRVALVQEYVPLSEGEFTVGVLSLPNKQLAGSVAMRRLFHCKLSVLMSTKAGLISTGYSQGLIEEFAALRAQAEEIAARLGSTGPLNIQGRVRNGVLLPFEINPRFSASTYLRAMAGFNEIDIYLRYRLCGIRPEVGSIRPGYYLRSLTETVVSREEIKQ
jgi:carbamoyl-phosphate synthase large subunit